jgi:beta-lactamase regulating signal transducer with metallopeptidase domain
MPFLRPQNTQAPDDNLIVSTPEENWINNDKQQSHNTTDKSDTTTPSTFDFNTLFQWMGVLWIGGAAVLFIRKITLYQSFSSYIKAGNTEVSSPEILDRLGTVCEELGIERQIDLHENPLASSPLILGFFKPTIVLPSTNISTDEFRYIMLHELTHYKRGDIFYKWLVQITLCLHWFNPLVCLMAKEVNYACELSCDEAVIRHLDTESKQAYGDVLIASIKTSGKYKPSIASVTLSENAQTVKDRLRAIMKYKEKKKSVLIISIALVVILGMGGILLGAFLPKAVANGDESGAVSLEEKSDAYKLIAQLAKIDTNQSVNAYKSEV